MWYLKSAAFVPYLVAVGKDYGMTNPLEDFATAWAEYFRLYLDYGPFGSSGGLTGSVGPWQVKLDVIGELLVRLRA